MMAGNRRCGGLFCGPCLVAVLLSCAAVSSAAEEGNSWTNRAGHVLKASPQSLRGPNVTFAREGGGKPVSYPLAVFLPSEQERLRYRLNDTTVPEGLKAAHEFAARTIKRSRLLNQSGNMPEPDFQQTLASTLSVFRAQAAPFVTKQLLSPERLELIVRQLAENKEP